MEALDPKFHLVLRPHRSKLQLGIWLCSLSIVLSYSFAKWMGKTSFVFLVKSLSFGLFLGITTLALVLGWYFWRLTDQSRRKLELNEEGLYDTASFCELGFVPIRSISNIRFAQIYGYEFLRIRFFSSTNPLKIRKDWLSELYRLFWGVDLWVPLFLYRVSRIDLESQLVHLDHLLKKEKTIQKEARPSVDSSEESATNHLGPELVSKLIQVDLAPPPLQQVSEKDLILEQIKKIKTDFKESGLDQKIVRLYHEKISRLPVLAVSGQVPNGITHVQSRQESPDYDEFSFRFEETPFTFGFRREVSGHALGLLSLGLRGRLMLSLRVQIEIADLSPLEIESCIPGDWQLQMERLYASVFKQVTKPDEGARHGTAVDSDLEDLKKKFGLGQ